MASVISLLFNKIKGRINNFVFYQVKGQQRIRSCGYKRSSPPTPAQQLQRCRMRAIVSFYQANRETLLTKIWKAEASDKPESGYNLFISANITVFNQEFRISDYSILCISKGKLNLPPCLTLHDYTEGKVTIYWQNDLPGDTSRNQDYLQAAWLKSDGSFTLHFIPDKTYTRDCCKAVLDIPEAGRQSIHLYVLFSDQSGRNFSSARYFYLPATKTTLQATT